MTEQNTQTQSLQQTHSRSCPSPAASEDQAVEETRLLSPKDRCEASELNANKIKQSRQCAGSAHEQKHLEWLSNAKQDKHMSE
jgi:hypothetical protein